MALETIELQPDDTSAGTVIWLHGLGADGHDFEPIVPILELGVAVRFVFPHAPVRPVTINGGMEMRAWYDIDPRSPLSSSDDIRASATPSRSLCLPRRTGACRARESCLPGSPRAV